MRLFVLMVQLLRFPSLVPSLLLSGKRPRTNQRRTNLHPKNSKTKNVRFIKITLSFTPLIPSLILPTDEREKTERTPTQLPTYKKWLNLKKVDSITDI